MPAPRTIATADLAAWVARLETEPEWSERLRATASTLAIRPSDLVLLIAAPDDFPRARGAVPLLRGFLVTVGRVADVASTIPSAGLASMCEADRRAHPSHAHAVIFAGMFAEAVRFRLPAP